MAQFHTADWWSNEIGRMLQDQTPEDLHLDYKGQRSLLPPGRGGSGGIDKQKRAEDISKDVSAFLNSDGGVLVYGVLPESYQLHVAGPGPAQRHHEHPDTASLPVLADVRQAAPVDLGLLTGRRLKPHRRLRLFVLPPRAHILRHRRVAALVPQRP